MRELFHPNMAGRRLFGWTAARAGSRRLSTYQEKLASEEVHAKAVKETWKKIVSQLISVYYSVY